MMLKLKLQYFGHLMRRVNSLERLWCWEGLGAGGEGDDRGWDGWMASLTHGRESEWTPEVGDGQGGLACCDSWGRKESDTTEQLNWTELKYIHIVLQSCRTVSSCKIETLHTLNTSFPYPFSFAVGNFLLLVSMIFDYFRYFNDCKYTVFCPLVTGLFQLA